MKWKTKNKTQTLAFIYAYWQLERWKYEMAKNQPLALYISFRWLSMDSWKQKQKTKNLRNQQTGKINFFVVIGNWEPNNNISNKYLFVWI